MNRGIWLGFLFFIALVLLGFGTLLVGNVRLLQKPFPVRIHFERVEGLRAGDKVRVEGVEYGSVGNIELDPQGGVWVTAMLNGPVEIHPGNEIYVESFSVLGGNFISIKRGDMRRPALNLAEGLHGKARPSALDEFGRIAADNRENLKDLISNLKDVSTALREGRGSAGKLINDPNVYEQLVKLLTEGRGAVDKLRELAETYVNELRDGKGPLRTLLSDQKMADDLKKMTENISQITDSLRVISGKLERGEGLAGAMINDKQLLDQLKRTVDNIEKMTEKFRKVTDNVENSTVGKLLQEDGMYKKGEKVLEDVDKLVGRAARAKVYLHTDAKHYPDTSHSIAKLNVRIEPDEDKYFWGGVSVFALDRTSDTLVFENQIEKDKDQILIKPDLGLAYRIPWILDRRITVKAGLMEGQPGGGVEFLWEDWGFFRHPVLFSFEGRLSYNDVDEQDLDENINGPMLRAFLQTPLWRPGSDVWWQKLLSYVQVYGGVSRITDDPEFLVGIGMEWRDEDIRTLVSVLGLSR